MAPPLLLLLACAGPPTPPGPPPHPIDSPRWSTAPHLAFAPLDAVGERAIAIDLPGGPIDRALADPDVTTVLTDRFATIFLHPRARPALTDRLGWPSLTLVDGDGCVRGAVSTPADADAVLAAINASLVARRDDVRRPLPLPQPRPTAPATHGVWTSEQPDAAPVDAVRGTPAVFHEGKPYFWSRDEAPALRCPL